MAPARTRCAPVLLLLLLAAVVRPGAGQPVSFHADVNGHSLQPPYFNLAEGTRISATATCGEEDSGAKTPRSVEDLYCKLVGGPVAGGDPNQTIQVRIGLGLRLLVPGSSRLHVAWSLFNCSALVSACPRAPLFTGLLLSRTHWLPGGLCWCLGTGEML